tara:strand:+ start:1357 stop:1578 length:222 start_codon:yes stop_codon:yes gene_type:complete
MSNQVESNTKQEIAIIGIQIQMLNQRIEKLESMLSAISSAADIKTTNTNQNLRGQTSLIDNGWTVRGTGNDRK